MKKLFNQKLIRFYLLFIGTTILLFGLALIISNFVYQSEDIFTVRSVDTTKYSRDMAGQMLDNNTDSDQLINSQVQAIAQTGANYIAIDTPYDDRFSPILRKWVKAARNNNLHIWFRGNFSGWEGWFNYPKIDRSAHRQMMNQFIVNNPDLFDDQDIFTACPECENGGPGDPRQTGDVAGFRNFMIQEYQDSQADFGKIGKKVITNYNSMNYDVASLIMDKETTMDMGYVVTIDHYVKDPVEISQDVDKLAKESGGKVVLGEIGAPIPDINGQMDQKQQADWLDRALNKLSDNKNLIGLNYWTSFGGSTEIWNTPTQPKEAVTILTKYYNMKHKIYPSLN